MGGEHLFVLPPHGLTGGKGLFHIQQTLVAAAAEPQGDIVLCLHELAVHQHIQQAQQLVGGFTPGKAWLFAGQLFPGVAGIAYRCSTRSLISCVRPWFQNWVPI